MLTAQPASIFGWDFELRGSFTALASFNWLGESGAIQVAGDTFQVVKQGWLSGQWTLEQGGAVYARATKTGVFSRSVEISTGSMTLTIRAQSPFTRGFDLEADGRPVGSVVPDHAFTRRSTLSIADRVPAELQVFAFWMIVLLWRRASRND